MTRLRKSVHGAISRKARKISVIISGMPSVGKTTAADAIAKRFHLKHLAGGDMLKRIAVERGYAPSGSDWWDTEEGMRFLSERGGNSNFDKEVDKRLRNAVTKGGVVVTSYPLPWLCDTGLKIWFKGSQLTRAKRLAGRDSISLKEALAIVRRRDARNRKIYKEIYGIKFGTDLSVFNYAIDTDKLSAAEVARLATRAVESYIDAGKTQ